MDQAIGTGKSVEKAIDDALLQLRTTRDNVDIKVLETGGLFKKAQVMVTLSEDYLQTLKTQKPEVKEEVKKVVEEVKPVTLKKAEEKLPEVKKEPVVTTLNVAPKEVKVVHQTSTSKDINEAEKGKEFLENFLKCSNIEGVVDVCEAEDEIFYTVMGEKVSQLIGYRGECLNSLQFLISVINGKNNRNNKHVRLDIDGYREKRKETLEMLARRVSRKVLKTGHQTRLEPMTAYERRIIHTTVQEFPGLTSLSRGEEPHRYLIIKLADDNSDEMTSLPQDLKEENLQENLEEVSSQVSEAEVTEPEVTEVENTEVSESAQTKNETESK